jgi:hypothetical protein
MITFIETILARLGGSAIVTGIGALINRFRPIKITGQRAPRNFFDHFGPGSSKEFVKSKLGAPHRQSESFWFYQFSDALAQFDFSGGESARSVALALTVGSPSSGFDLPMIGVPIGKLTLDHFAADVDGKFVYRSSLRTWELIYCVKFPPHWASNYYTFGALSLLVPFSFKESSFDTQLAQRTPHLAAKGTLVNWVGISDTSEEMWFDWSIAVPASA